MISPMEIKVFRFQRNNYFRLRKEKARKISFTPSSLTRDGSCRREQQNREGTGSTDD